MKLLPVAIVLLLVASAAGQARTQPPQTLLTITDDTGQPIRGAQVTIIEQSQVPINRWTDDAGHCRYPVQGEPYQLRISKSGYYSAQQNVSDPRAPTIQATLTREHLLQQQVEVTATAPAIDTQQASDQFSMDTPEITNVPYPTSRDIRNLLPFIPGIVADGTGQVHIAGSESWQTLYLLDNFDIRSPASGVLAMRVSADAVRSIDAESTRYPVRYGRSTGGVIAFYTGTGDNKFRFNATNFIPSFKSQKGIRFDKVVPRFTFSGPIDRNHAWFFDGLEVEYDNIFIPELPSNADTNHLLRGSNLIKVQANASSTNSATAGLLFNGYHSPYDGISPLVPQQSTTKRNTTAWLPYLRDQQRFANGTMLDAGFGVLHIRDGYEPHGNSPYQLTPETAHGSYFENLSGMSQREEGNATIYFPEKKWMGSHDLRAGLDLDHIRFGESVSRAPVNYLREDGTLLRRSTFPATPPFVRHNAELGAYLEDHWNTSLAGLLIEPGLRFDWDEIIRRPLFSPRIAVVYAPGAQPNTKISAGIGIYYGHTQLDYLESALAGTRLDTYYGPDGATPAGPPAQTTFAYDQSNLRESRAINWSAGLEQKLPGSIYASANFVEKHTSNLFTYFNQSGPGALSGNYLLTDARRDHDYVAEIDARRTFSFGSGDESYTLFAAYTRSSARTNAAVDYVPAISLLGAQQSGPLPWDAPNRILSWGWLPLDLPWFRNRWDFVYTLDWRTGFPITSVNANHQVVGNVGSHRFPDFLSFSPGVEWRFHLHGYYFGLRGVLENATDRQNPSVVNNNISSPNYLNFTEPLGRAFTARIRLIQSKK